MQSAAFAFPTWDKVHEFNEKTTSLSLENAGRSTSTSYKAGFGKQPLTKPAPVELGAAVQPKP
jgi:hypothetical protein